MATVGDGLQGAEKRKEPSARELIAEGMRRQRGAAASVGGKSEKIAVPFGAYLSCKKLFPPCAPRRPGRSRTVACTCLPSSHTL
jgi:hypothetical protein